MGIGIAFVAVTLGISIPLLAIWCEYRKSKTLIDSFHKERLAALERGLELPPYPKDAVDSDAETVTATRSTVDGTGLKQGLVWLAVGVGLWLFLSPQNRGMMHPSVGAIPGAIGVAFLIYWVVEGRNKGPANP